MHRLEWSKVVSEFVKRFEAEFSTCSKKAHFDCVPPHFTVIDGARSKWCHLLLVNAIIGILDFESFNLAARRKFNQQQILADCLRAALEEQGIVEASDGSFGTISVTLDSSWQDMKSLRNFLERNAPYKSKEKYLGILDILLSHKVVRAHGFDIEKSINAAIVKALSPSNRRAGRKVVTTPAPLIRSKRVQAQAAAPPSPSDEDSDPPVKRPRRSPTKKVQPEEEVTPVIKKPRRRTILLPKVQASPPPARLRRTYLRRPAEPPQIKAAVSVSMERTDDHSLGFGNDHLFDDHDDIDPNAQPWELLEPAPDRNHSPKHYVHGGVVRQMDACAVGALRASPLGMGDDPSVQSDGARLVVGLLPFPDGEELSALAVRMNPFPIEHDEADKLGSLTLGLTVMEVGVF